MRGEKHELFAKQLAAVAAYCDWDCAKSTIFYPDSYEQAGLHVVHRFQKLSS